MDTLQPKRFNTPILPSSAAEDAPSPAPTPSRNFGAAILGILQEPLLHFLLIGACLFGLYFWVQSPPQTSVDAATTTRPAISTVIEVSPDLVDRLAKNWERQWRRLPDEAELANLLEGNLREEVMYREALRMGLDQNDTIIRRWLMQKLDFLSQDIAPPPEPTLAELHEYFATHTDQFMEPVQVSFTHRFFNPDLRGGDAAAQQQAQQGLTRLQSGRSPVGEGDRFLLAATYRQQTPLQVRRVMGQAFTDQLLQLPLDQWQGPIRSGFGYHLVRVSDRQAAHPATFESVREEVRTQWLEAQQAEANEAFYQTLRDRYRINIAPDLLAQHPQLSTVLTQDNLIGQELPNGLSREEIEELTEGAA